MKEICRLLGITQNISTAYHPRTDGQSEQTNQWVEQYLRFWVKHQQDNWNHYLPLAEFAHNSWPNETTKQTPFEALMGYTPRAEIFDVTTSIPTVALCHDSDVGMDYFSFRYLSLPTIVPSSSCPLVPNLDYLLFTHTR